MITVHEVEQGTDEWHDLRVGKYTGSNAHKLLKFGRINYALTEDKAFMGNFYTKRGHILEDEAIELYEQIRDTKVNRLGFVTNSRYPICGYSPDGISGEVLIEVKCFNESKHLQIYNGDIPLEILAQIYFGMLICEMRQAHLIIYNPDIENPKQAFKIIEVKHNRNILNNFKRILKPKEVAHAR